LGKTIGGICFLDHIDLLIKSRGDKHRPETLGKLQITLLYSIAIVLHLISDTSVYNIITVKITIIVTIR